MPAVPLCALHPGETCHVIALQVPPQGQTRLLRRLADLGFVAGTPLTLRRRGPFGDPIQVRIRGYDLTLRAADANLILVERGHP